MRKARSANHGLGAAASAVLLAFGLTSSALAGSAQWNSSPATNDWNTAGNWTPVTVPNGPTDTATFAVSSRRNVMLSDFTEVDGIVFNTGASAFTITSGASSFLNITGAGITNNSGITQNFVADVGGSDGDHGAISFFNNATAGSSITFNVNGAAVAGGMPAALSFGDNSNAGTATFFMNGAAVSTPGPPVLGSGGSLSFSGTASAASGNFTNFGGTAAASAGGVTQFVQTATAGNGHFVNNGGAAMDAGGGRTLFFGSATASHGTFVNNGSNASGTEGFVEFDEQSTAGSAMITNNGGLTSGGFGGVTFFFDQSTGGTATIVSNGGTVDSALGGTTLIEDQANAGAATLIANGGVAGAAGGTIQFTGASDGGMSRIELFGNGNLDIGALSSSSVGVGSIEGSGIIFLGSKNLSVGSNGVSTEFSGTIQDGGVVKKAVGGSLTKVGGGILTLSGTNTYTGATTVNAGSLLVNGSMNSAVTVNAGVLGGSGDVGAVTIKKFAILSPGTGPGILDVNGNLSLAMKAKYLVDLDGSVVGTGYDQTDVTGSVTLSRAKLTLSLGFAAAVGTQFVIINNDGADQVMGMFVGFRQGKKFNIAGEKFQISYHGGDGNDVVLTVVNGAHLALERAAVPEPESWALIVTGAAVLLLARIRLRRSKRA